MSMSEYSSSPSRPGSPPGPLPDPSSSAPDPFRFQWDAASRRGGGPGSVSEMTEGRGGGDYFGMAPRIDIHSTSSISLPLGALPLDWSSSTQGFNAISTVLNNPRRSQAPPKAHSWLPPVAPALLPRVKRKDFDSYLHVITPEWERLMQNAQLSLDEVPQLDNSPASPPSSSELTPLCSVPSVFFEPEFDLSNPLVFGAVTGHQPGDEDVSDPCSPSYSFPLLEKLSTSFFAALTNLQDLQTESEGLLKEVDEKSAKRGLAIVRKESRLKNLRSVSEGGRGLGAVVEMIGVAKGLVGAGQWGEALDVSTPSPRLKPVTHRGSLRKTNGRLPALPPTPESPPPEEEDSGSKESNVPSIRLSILTAFASLPSHLRALTVEITSSLTSDLVNVLKVDLLERVKCNNSGSESASNMNVTLADKSRPLLNGLLRTKGVREAVAQEVKGMMKHHFPSFDPDEEDKSQKSAPSGLPNLLRAKAHSEFLSIITQVYRRYTNAIEGLQTQNEILSDVLQKQHRLSTIPIDLPSFQEELSDIVSSAADLSNKFAAKVISYRLEQHVQLDLPNFLNFFNESWGFVVKCEIICRRVIMGLRGVILSQAKLFLQTFHQSRINQSAKLVEDEQWNPMEVPPAVQHLADVLVDSAVRDSPELVIQGNRSTSPSPSNGDLLQSPASLNSGNLASAQTTPTSKCIRIEDRPYFCVLATGAVLGLVVDYIKLVVNLSTLNTEAMGRVIEFLKAYNSRTCQVVLGAGAMRSAGLKNITAKHLALASQSLSIMVALIPYIRETFRRHLSPNQAVMLVEFDKLKRDFQEHQNEIHAKLIAIMGDRITAHIKSLQGVNWDAPKQNDGHDYMELLVKETVTLHKVLSRYLAAPTVECSPPINHRLSDEYLKVELQSQEAKDRMLADARFLHQKLSALKNVNAPTNMLETLVGEKLVPRKSGIGTFRAIPTPNERIKGFLSRRDSSKPDKPLPTPEQAPPGAPSPMTAEDGRDGSDKVISPPRSSSRAARWPRGEKVDVSSPARSEETDGVVIDRENGDLAE
ncbi:Vps54-like protein-domain-containing protein [Pisolithus orientalis]|uniref:Vps54-like protein-domain-containing protein n=1 Tax=Pisolithus orientalis TaxID=936130 RepID=UPI002224F124|nr:Vps54-like protein-domain-containing protein [Pisolithus orientalis]KAI6028484.1 Vps54-like protein-domain-containing protein [Pisolithus orientalis]